MAGLTLAAIAIPEQMATARLGGFAPQIGFFAFMAGSLGFAMLGSNNAQERETARVKIIELLARHRKSWNDLTELMSAGGAESKLSRRVQS